MDVTDPGHPVLFPFAFEDPFFVQLYSFSFVRAVYGAADQIQMGLVAIAGWTYPGCCRFTLGKTKIQGARTEHRNPGLINITESQWPMPQPPGSPKSN